MAVRLAQGLVIASLVLLIIYGADVGAQQGKEDSGFLPMDAMARGIGLGVPAIALSTAAFFVAMKEKSALVSVLLLVNGVLIIIGGIAAVSSSTGGYAVAGAGVWVLALGIIKSLRARAIKTA